MNDVGTGNRTSETDVIVVGVGTSGEDLSLRLMGAGLSVVGIEASLVGGECPYWACLPSKMMIRAANALQEARRVSSLAGQAQVIPDWRPVAARVRAEATGNWDDSVAVKRFEARGGRLIHGRGKLAGPRTVQVGDETITARIGVVLATGSRPFIPQIDGLNEAGYWTTHELTQVESLPGSLIVTGGGAIGVELGQVMSRFGVKVTIVESGERLLPAEEPEASEVIARTFATEGIAVRTGVAIQRVSARGGKKVVQLSDGTEVEAEQLLIATGRRPHLKDLGLESIGLDGDARALAVDERMRAAEGLWAMGDVTAKGMFTHVALYQSAIIAADILNESIPAARYDAVPRAVFSDPEVASAGVTEADARSAGLDVEAITKQLPSTFRGWLHSNGDGVIKLIVDRSSGRLVGATAVGPSGAETIGMLSLAIHSRVPVSDLQSMIYAFPTFYGAVGEAVGAYGRGLATVLDPAYTGFQSLDTLTRIGSASAKTLS